jgi:hypothetical protein
VHPAPTATEDLGVVPDDGTTARIGVVVRDIARSGLAGLLTGLLVVGPGGRLVMRLAALLEPSAAGRLTENGNVIGEITFGGSFALLLVGIFLGMAGAVVWVVVSPWLPAEPRTRALVAAPVAVALTAVGLIDGFNPDFGVLHRNVGAVALLVLLVAVSGLVLSAVDAWLDNRLPPAGASLSGDAIYAALTIAGAALILPPTLAGYFGSEIALGLALAVTGLATVLRWAYRYQGRAQPAWLVPFGRAALAAAVALGAIAVAPDIARAIGLSFR